MKNHLITSFAIALVSLSSASAEIVGYKLSGVTTSNFGTTPAVNAEYPVGTAWTAMLKWESTSSPLSSPTATQAQYALTEFTLSFAGKSGTWTTSALAGKGTFTQNYLGASHEIQFTTSWGPENLTNPALADLGPYSINLILGDSTGTAIPSLGSAPASLDLADWTDTELKIYLNNDGNKTIFGEIRSIDSLFAPEISIKLPGGKTAVDGKSTQNFGKTKVGKKGKAKAFVIRNTGSTAISGLKVSPNGKSKKEFVVGKPSSTTLAPGASSKVKVSFKPKKKGKRKAALKITSTEGGSDSFEIGLVGTGEKP